VATLRELRTRVVSITNIQRVTNAMQMVAAAKMRRAQEAIAAARPYAQRLDRLLKQLHQSVDTQEQPLFAERAVQRVALVVVTSDRGLCGGFNSNLCRRVQAELGEYADAEVELITVGRKGRDFFNARGYTIASHHADVFSRLEFARATAIAQDLTRRFAAAETDRVLLCYSEFVSVAAQVPVVSQLLPIVPEEGAVEAADYTFEPGPERLLETLVPRQVNFQIWRALLESNAGFFAAQMTAMDNATKNAGDLIEELTREVNKERQASITLELMDIIGGAEAVAQ
jgi:F-type H+-transporting ATPase subunit gamma